VWQTILEQAIEFRRHLHQHPELSWHEINTADSIRQKLATLGIPWQACANTGTIARISADKKGLHIALRGDIDALPIEETSGVDWASHKKGCMHACGHDGDTAALVATAAWLKLHEHVLQGPVSLIFQPAEEGGHGAKKMIEEGALKGVDAIYGWHNWPPIPFGRAVCPPGPVMSANSTFEIEVTGQGGHGSQPEACAAPVLAGSAIVMALQQVISRRLPPQTSAVLSVTSFDAVSASNVIPEKARLGGGIRASDTASREQIGEIAAQVVVNTAKAHGCVATLSCDPCYGATVNHPNEAKAFEEALQAELSADWRSDKVPIPIMASEDFSYYLEEVPGAFALIGAGDDDYHPCHSPHYDFNDELIALVVRLYSHLVGAPLPTEVVPDF